MVAHGSGIHKIENGDVGRAQSLFGDASSGKMSVRAEGNSLVFHISSSVFGQENLSLDFRVQSTSSLSFSIQIDLFRYVPQGVQPPLVPKPASVVVRRFENDGNQLVSPCTTPTSSRFQIPQSTNAGTDTTGFQFPQSTNAGTGTTGFQFPQSTNSRIGTGGSLQLPPFPVTTTTDRFAFLNNETWAVTSTSSTTY